MDHRAVERNIKKGYISKEDYQAHLDSLPDMAENTELMEVNQWEEIALRDEKRKEREAMQPKEEAPRFKRVAMYDEDEEDE